MLRTTTTLSLLVLIVGAPATHAAPKAKATKPTKPTKPATPTPAVPAPDDGVLIKDLASVTSHANDGEWTRDGGTVSTTTGGHYTIDVDVADFTLDVDIEQTAGPHGGLGVATRTSNVDTTWNANVHGYWFNLTFAGSYNIFACKVTDVCNVLTGPQSKPGYKPTPLFKGSTTHLRVTQSGEHFAMYADGTLVFEGKDSMYAKGKLGFAVEPGMSVRFRKLRVTKPVAN